MRENQHVQKYKHLQWVMENVKESGGGGGGGVRSLSYDSVPEGP